MKANIEIEELEEILRKIVRDVVQEEIMKLRATLLPFVSDEEQKEIEDSYKAPSADVAKTVELEE